MRQIPRLFVETELAAGMALPLDGGQAHYLAHVLRLAPGAPVLLCDDRTGEWRAGIETVSKKQIVLRVEARTKPREAVPDLWLLTAPIRRERFEWIVEKATELGIARVVPVLTERTNHERLNPGRLRAHMVEAAEQCERTALPELAEAVKLDSLLQGWDASRTLLFADEEGGADMLALKPRLPAAILIGPEGGFSDAERARILAVPGVRRLGLGPRILRADTAVVAAIAQFQLFSSASVDFE
jgi:16S rRNA (uracil1498-N3)-methyltransferase